MEGWRGGGVKGWRGGGVGEHTGLIFLAPPCEHLSFSTWNHRWAPTEADSRRSQQRPTASVPPVLTQSYEQAFPFLDFQ